MHEPLTEKQIRHRGIVLKNVLVHSWRTVREIADASGLQCATVSGALTLMKRDKIISEKTDGVKRYKLKLK